MSHPGFLREVQGIDDTLHLSENRGAKGSVRNREGKLNEMKVSNEAW